MSRPLLAGRVEPRFPSQMPPYRSTLWGTTPGIRASCRPRPAISSSVNNDLNRDSFSVSRHRLVARPLRKVADQCEKKKALPQSGHDFVFRFGGSDMGSLSGVLTSPKRRLLQLAAGGFRGVDGRSGSEINDALSRRGGDAIWHVAALARAGPPRRPC